MLSAKVTPARTDVPRSYASCALVGNGPGMYLPGMGEIVDRHDAVFKFNLYNLAQRAGKLSDNTTSYVGNKSDFRMFNKKRSEVAELMELSPARAERWMLWHYGSALVMNRLLKRNPSTLLLSPDLIKWEAAAYFGMRTDMHRIGLVRNMPCPINMPTGVHSILLALQMCEQVNLFGFSHSMTMLHDRTDATSPRISSSHNWEFDTIMLRLLALSGRVSLCTS